MTAGVDRRHMSEMSELFDRRLRAVLGEGAYRYAAPDLVASRARAVELIDAADVVSFDFFDTLVTRLASTPDAAQRFVGRLLQEKYGRGDDFLSVRKHAEAMARALHQDEGDVGLDAIYSQFDINLCWTAEIVREARRVEEQVESDMLAPREKVIALLRYAKEAGKRVIVVSDSYFDSAFFNRSLASLGIADSVDEVYVSSVRLVRKDTGALWDLVLRAEQIEPARMVHFGDNPHSDIGMAASRGISRGYILPPSVILALAGGSLPVDSDWRDHLLIGPVIARLGSDPWVAERAPDRIRLDRAEDLGYAVFGPVLFGFVAWLFAHPALNRVSKLFFLSREGYFLSALYSRVREAAGLSATPQAAYLYVSRRLALVAAQAVEFDPMQMIGKGGFRGTIAEFLAVRVGLDTSSETFDPAVVAQLSRHVTLPADGDAVHAVMNALEPVIRRRAREELDAFCAYAHDVGFAQGGNAALVDIGYSGTIQHALQRVLECPLIGLYMMTAPHAAQVRQGRGLAFGCFQDAVYGDMRPPGFLNYTVLLEALLTAPHGQVVRIRYDDRGEAVPEFAEGGVSQKSFADLERIFLGAQRYADDLIRAGGVASLHVASEGSTPFMMLAKKVFDGSVVIGESMLASLSMEDKYSGNGEVSLAERIASS